MKHIHILGICGTFMGALALLAREKGYKVTGSDQNVYPPMSTYLAAQGIKLISGYDYDIKSLNPDQVIIGNTMRRGMPIVEHLLNSKLEYFSGPEWLYQEILKQKKVIAIAGTHGKTTTTSMVIKLMDDMGLNPSFLVGGITQDFGVSSRLTNSEYFVIEADEYDTAFFDKRSKFMHYHPDVLVINNLEFDHADIFNSIEDIYRQFHHLMRLLPGKVTVIYPEHDTHIDKLLAMGFWSERCPLQGDNGLDIKPILEDYSQFEIIDHNKTLKINWSLLGEHNAKNALSAYAVLKTLGVSLDKVTDSFKNFKGVKRRLECIAENIHYAIYDDFAHHPTAIAETLKAIKARATDKERVVAILEPRSNTMKMGVQEAALINALNIADEVWFYQNSVMQWQAASYAKDNFLVFDQVADIAERFKQSQNERFTHYVIMSNGAFDGLHQALSTLAVKEKGIV
ncbi:UDP-N-acetylmuramate:L-alanyl-gamma-D-glutamyl-meso-diaminopimelate ligase [Cysteiniphilum halobium]|uniref:UDP-N-acetylmuramate:L-alanyl-gamma-D-glutamyl- meso-diaminopimelate ligase n=1 Tax=Cysteiniphilum halobium TaxID=2219059 RepID=UPI000E65CAB5|nr:UDP-N-acetylmuramate:L-alanyl-gamma-D-glutamyl-meso-diaminopimelate ligase [Cysteiniphilum halobium]